MMTSRDRSLLLDRALVVAAIVVPTVYALVVNLGALELPPAWDSAGTVSPAALTMVELDFDIWQLAQLPQMLQGGPSTHATSIYTIALALLIAAFGPDSAFLLAHLSSIALVGILSGATYLLARERATLRMSVLVAVTVGILPIVLQQSADIYLDLPLAVVTTLTCWTTARRKFGWTALLVLIGIGIKTSAVFLLPLLLLAKPEDKKWPRHLAQSALAGLVALVPFAVALITTDRFDTVVTGEARKALIQSSTALLVLTVDVFSILVVYLLVMYGRLRTGKLGRIARITAVLVGGFLVVHLGTILTSGTIAILPRYYIVILPPVLVAALPNAEPGQPLFERKRVLALSLVTALAVFSIINHRGDFYPLPNHDFYVVAERSTRAQDLLRLQIEGTKRLASTGLPIVVGTQAVFRYMYPDMGYVSERPEQIISLIDARPDELPDSFAMLIERRYKNPLATIAQTASAQGYDLVYEVLSNGEYEFQLIIATRSQQ